MRVAVAAALLCASTAFAQSGAARYAAVQLRIAEASLERAREAAASADHARAGELAWQAGVDARLTWAMSDSGALRADAASIARQATALIRDLASRHPGRAAASYRSAADPAQASIPSRR